MVKRGHPIVVPQIDAANQMVVGVGDIQLAAGEAQTGRFVESAGSSPGPGLPVPASVRQVFWAR